MKLCLVAVKNDHDKFGHALFCVPEAFMKVSQKEYGALCLEAVIHSDFAILVVPNKLKTAELCYGLHG